MAPSHVLVPLDGSPLAEDAFVHALETFDCPVTVLNVVTPLDSSMSESGILEHVSDDERSEKAQEHLDETVARGRDRVDAADQAVDTVVEIGDPAETILDYADESDVDHIVMGGHGGDRTDLARRLLGTVATAVVGEASVTVTVVR